MVLKENIMTRHNKKAQGLSINTIIIAALALIVLIVVAAIFTGKFKSFSQTLEGCSTRQGKCKPGCSPDETIIRYARCPEPGDDEKAKTCCIQPLSK